MKFFNHKNRFFYIFFLLFLSFSLKKAPFFLNSKGYFIEEKKQYFTPSSFFEPLFYHAWSLEGNFLVSYLPFFSFEGRVLAQEERIFPEEYIVQEGDTLSLIAEKFKISVETILSANHLEKNQKLLPGQRLIIMPFTGFFYLVEKRESLETLAKKYKVKKEDILFVNEEVNEILLPGDVLFIPGVLPEEKKTRIVWETEKMICPIALPCRKTQGLHFFNAIDFSNGVCGENVFAVLPGNVQKTGFDKTAGNYVRILHPNGLVTFYGHLTKIFVIPGQRVSQGEIIGLTGRTGLATGCHLHFEVRGGKNPF